MNGGVDIESRTEKMGIAIFGSSLLLKKKHLRLQNGRAGDFLDDKDKNELLIERLFQK